jgi:hypothetical protein
VLLHVNFYTARQVTADTAMTRIYEKITLFMARSKKEEFLHKRGRKSLQAVTSN